MHKAALLTALCLVFAQPAMAADPEPASSARSMDALKKRAKEILELSVEGDATLVGAPSPVNVEFKESARVAILVAEDLRQRGFPAVSASEAPSTLKLSARISLRGPEGRMTFDLGPMFEKIMAGRSAAELAQIDPAQNVLFGTTAYLRTAGLARVGLFNPYLYRYFTAMSISDALGVHQGVNKALTGDARGVCLFNCENWKNTHHWVIVDAVVASGGSEKSARVVLKAWMTEIDPQTAFDIAYEALLQDRLLKGATQ